MSFVRDQKVRLVKDCQDLAHGPEIFKEGETGTLGRLYRTQEGVQVWELILDQKRPFGGDGREITLRVCVPHTSIEKI